VLTGAAVASRAGAGLHQIENAEQYEEHAALGIFQHSTIPPGTTIVGQVVIRPLSLQFKQLRIVVPAAGGPREFVFVRRRI
jgi:hypothetical protein